MPLATYSDWNDYQNRKKEQKVPTVTPEDRKAMQEQLERSMKSGVKQAGGLLDKNLVKRLSQIEQAIIGTFDAGHDWRDVLRSSFKASDEWSETNTEWRSKLLYFVENVIRNLEARPYIESHDDMIGEARDARS